MAGYPPFLEKVASRPFWRGPQPRKKRPRPPLHPERGGVELILEAGASPRKLRSLRRKTAGLNQNYAEERRYSRPLIGLN